MYRLPTIRDFYFGNADIEDYMDGPTADAEVQTEEVCSALSDAEVQTEEVRSALLDAEMQTDEVRSALVDTETQTSEGCTALDAIQTYASSSNNSSQYDLAGLEAAEQGIDGAPPLLGISAKRINARINAPVVCV